MGRRTAAQGWTYYSFDPEGSVVLRSDAVAGIRSALAYDAHGRVVSLAGDATPDPFGFHARQGYYGDTETGLCYCRARYYDPQAGRWVTRDPLGYAGGIDLYGYCEGGPVGVADPSGLIAQAAIAARILGSEAAAIAAAAAGAAYVGPGRARRSTTPRAMPTARPWCGRSA